MDFLVEFLRTLFEFVFLIAVAVCGVFIGKGLRAKKDKSKKAE
jgi:hypothetical protein